MINTKHNSNQKIKQITLIGEIVQEYVYYCLGFVPADVIRLKNKAWFIDLDLNQIKTAENYLNKNYAD